MKILVFADSHGWCSPMLAETERLCEAVTIDYIIHLGDLVRDAQTLQEKFPDIPVLYVYGNCDFTSDKANKEKEIELGGKKFFILHGDTRNVKYSLDSLKTISAQKDYDMILYAHTHTPHSTYENGTYIINPGSISLNRDGSNSRSYCVIDITDDGSMQANIVKQ